MDNDITADLISGCYRGKYAKNIFVIDSEEIVDHIVGIIGHSRIKSAYYHRILKVRKLLGCKQDST